MARVIGTVDIGTNSVLLLVARAEDDGRLRILHEACTITRLGAGVAASGTLEPVAIARTLDVLRSYAGEMERRGVVCRAAVGTAALRRARNAGDFTGPAAALLGCPLEIVSGQREGELVLAGVEGSFGPLVARTAICDVGGGSTELILVDRGASSHELASLEIGAVRLTERCIRSDPPTAAELAEVRQAAAAALAQLGASFACDARVVGVAGTVTTLATVALQMSTYDTERVNGYELARGELSAQIARFAAVDLARRREIIGLEPARADVILAGALIVDEILRCFGAEKLTVCDRGVRWGRAQELARAGKHI